MAGPFSRGFRQKETDKTPTPDLPTGGRRGSASEREKQTVRMMEESARIRKASSEPSDSERRQEIMQSLQSRQREDHEHRLKAVTGEVYNAINEILTTEGEKNSHGETKDVSVLLEKIYHTKLSDEQRLLYDEKRYLEYPRTVEVDQEAHQQYRRHGNYLQAGSDSVDKLTIDEQREYLDEQKAFEREFRQWREDNQRAREDRSQQVESRQKSPSEIPTNSPETQSAPLDKGKAPDTTEHLEDHALVSFVIEHIDHKYITSLNTGFKNSYQMGRITSADREIMQDALNFTSKRNKKYKSEYHKQKAITSLQRAINKARAETQTHTNSQFNNFLTEYDRLKQVYSSDQAVPSSS